MEDTETSGRIRVMVAPELIGLFGREARAFEALYPQARIDLESAMSRTAVESLLSRRADLAVVTRELEPEERSVVVKGGMELSGYRFARDGFCFVVNPANPVDRLSAEQIRGVYLDSIRTWAELGGRPDPIRPVIPPPGSDAMAAFLQRVMGGVPPVAAAIRAASDSDIVARVARDPAALGFVALAWCERGVKPLRVAALTGLPYVRPDAEKIYDGSYPLTREFRMYVRDRGARLANGLVTYVSSWDGQKIVHEAGWVPTAVPVRFVRRSPMLSTH